jgi:nucleoside-diphosphate-sugar epimerase
MLVCKVGYIPKSFNDYAATTVYGKSKVIMEEFIKQENFDYDWTIIRPTSIWGPWFDTYKDFFIMIKNKTYFNIKDLTCFKTYGYIENAVFQMLCLLHSNQSAKRVFYIGDKPLMNISEWAIEIADTWGVRKPVNIPFIIIKSAALVGDFLKMLNIQFPITSFRLKNMTTNNIINIDDTYAVCGETPYSRKQGVESTIEWLKTQEIINYSKIEFSYLDKKI